MGLLIVAKSVLASYIQVVEQWRMLLGIVTRYKTNPATDLDPPVIEYNV